MSLGHGAVVDGSDRAQADLEKRVDITFIANPVQNAFINSRAEADLFASRLGEGKSAALCWASWWHAKHNPGARHVFVRDTWINLEKTTYTEFLEWFPIGVFGEWSASKKLWTWKAGEMRGAHSYWVGMDQAEDASKVLSMALGAAYMDEPAPAVGSGGIAVEVFEHLMTRLRQKGMEWRQCKVAVNNPDESHWTYTKFVDPGTPGYKCWQTKDPENLRNLPTDYYEKVRKTFAHRPDLIDRFVVGKFGYQQQGKPITPQWDDRLHLALGLAPVRGVTLHLLWDFGLNPTCIITQVTPLGFWHVLEAHVGEDIGVAQLIEHYIAPRIAQAYPGARLEHIGDPNGEMREQSDVRNSAVLVIKQMLGGPFVGGPGSLDARIDPLQAVLSRTLYGRGVIQVDRQRARAVWHALRGGWHRQQHRDGSISPEPKKNIHSHPGDAMGYGAAVLFPLARHVSNRPANGVKPPAPPRYFHGAPTASIGFERPGLRVPKHGERMQ